jgi:hypothetical protein
MTSAQLKPHYLNKVWENINRRLYQIGRDPEKIEDVNWEFGSTLLGRSLWFASSRSPLIAILINQLPKDVLFHDLEASNDQKDGVRRVLDDSPKEDWVQFFKYETSTENHEGFSKKQNDGSTLLVLRETYRAPASIEFPPRYFLIVGKEVRW